MQTASWLFLVAVASASADDTNLTSYDLSGDAVCINGCAAPVQAVVRDETLWVITIGTVSPSLSWCTSGDACMQFAKPVSPCPTTAGTTVPLNPGGLQNPDCKENPTFCGASQAVLSTCDFGLFLGDSDTTYKNMTLHFRGQTILSESIKKLASLGMSKATHVLVTGVTWAGTAAILQADYIGTLLKANVPGLQSYKVVPVDAMHPDFISFYCASDLMKHDCANATNPTWLPAAQQSLYNLTQAQKFLPGGCNTADCLFMENLLAKVKTPIFVVQQMPGTWDFQCNFEGQTSGNILQVSCSEGGNYFRPLHACTQYPDLCDAQQHVAPYIVPLQQKYISGVGKTPGFVHSCFLGAYFNSAPYNNVVLKLNTSWWNQIQVGGKTMRQALDAWWSTGASTQYIDKPWNPAGTPPPHGQESHVDAPIVPWYTNRFMQNPTCRGNPWYLGEAAAAVVV